MIAEAPATPAICGDGHPSSEHESATRLLVVASSIQVQVPSDTQH